MKHLMKYSRQQTWKQTSESSQKQEKNKTKQLLALTLESQFPLLSIPFMLKLLLLNILLYYM